MILIPPSEGKTPGGTQRPLGCLGKHPQVIYDRLMSYRGNLTELYGVKGKALDVAIAANQSLLTSPTMPAIERYSGVVYDGIDYSSLSKDAKIFFNEHVRIVSALFGLVKPTDLIPDYKLKIEKLDAAKYWQPIIAEQLKNQYVIDLLPQAHQKAVAYEQGVKIEFIFEKNGKAMPAGHFGKLIKGQFIRFLCEHQVTDMSKIFVKAHPKSSKIEVKQIDPAHYEIWVREAPDKGKANQAIIEALSDYLDVAKSKITVSAGHTSRNKVLEIL
jgi:uncharacterized protein